MSRNATKYQKFTKLFVLGMDKMDMCVHEIVNLFRHKFMRFLANSDVTKKEYFRLSRAWEKLEYV